MIKAVFFDIDGTLVTSEAKARESTRKAIRLLQQKGIYCGAATGRGPVGIVKHTDNLPLDFYVTYNGQYVYTPLEVVYEKPLKPTAVNALADYAQINNKQMIFGGSQQFFGSQMMIVGQKPWMKALFSFVPSAKYSTDSKWLQKILALSKKNLNKEQILAQPIYQCVLIADEKETKKMERMFPECEFTRSNPLSADIIAAGGSKIIGVQEIGKYFGFEPSEALVFGDSYNDAEMITGAGIGVAMGNGEPAIQKMADYVTGSNEEDGIAEALIHYGLLTEAEIYG